MINKREILVLRKKQGREGDREMWDKGRKRVRMERSNGKYREE